MKHLTAIAATMLMALSVPAAADTNVAFDPATCTTLAEKYRTEPDSMSYAEVDGLLICITTMADMKSSQQRAEKADRAIVKLYGLNEG